MLAEILFTLFYADHVFLFSGGRFTPVLCRPQGLIEKLRIGEPYAYRLGQNLPHRPIC